tara:strand:+ start:2464 stop:3753 length:1290 start_codon:yes stop_codon:yes gene_type:complete
LGYWILNISQERINMLKLFKNKKVWIPLLIIILSSIIYFFKRMDVEEIYVEAEYIELRDIIHKVNASGRIQPEEEVQITSTITGWITKITVSEGDTVNPGQHLINIDEKQIRQRYNNTLSQVKSSDANLRRVQSQMTRTETLYAQSLISKQELEQIEASYQMALSQSEQANANLLSAEDELSKTQLTSPKYGIVTSITKEEGEMAVGGMFNPGVLMTIADLSRMEVEVDVNENDVVKIEVGDKSEIEIDAYPDSIFYGVVSEIAHTALSANMGMQQQVTNFKVKVKMLSVPNKVRPGMSSTVNIITEIIKSTISIPIQSLTSRPENYKELELNEEKSDENEDDILFKKNKPIDVVFVLVDTFEGEKVPEGKKYALVRPIKVGTSSENFYAIKSGIEVSEIIVTGGYRVLSKELNHGDIVIMNSTLKVQN